MKMAILGRSPLALEAALRFHLHGAALTWYVDQDDLSGFASPSFVSSTFTSELGLGILKEINLTYSPKTFSWKEWQESYENPLMNFLRTQQEVKTDEVLSVSKRYLAPFEQVEGKTRFYDLFRVIHKVDPRTFIEEQKETNPETYQRLTDEFVHSLSGSIEMYQDYDLVLDLRSDLSKASASVTGRALGESRDSDKVTYALKALGAAKTMVPNPDLREMALVGSDSLAAEILLALEDWVREPRSRLFIVTAEESPFDAFLSVANGGTREKLENLFASIEAEHQAEIDVFTKKLREWQELDDFVQVKIPKPVEPIPRLNYFSGHNVSALDELIDRKRFFLTLERPDFRSGKKHPDNNHLELKTIGVDHILIAHAKKDKGLLHVDEAEPGFFSLIPQRPSIEGAWEKDLSSLEGIEDEIFKLFSPVHPH